VWISQLTEDSRKSTEIIKPCYRTDTTDAEIEQFLTAARKGLRGPRDFLLALLA
jgi:hypothetical protein